MRTSKTLKLAGAAVGAAAALTMAAGPAFADGSVSGNLRPVALNGVDGSGMAKVTVTGNTISFTLQAQGLLAGSPHAAHIHYGADARHSCPTAADDKNGDGHINTTEGGPAYGAIVVSLTTSGDTSPASGLAIDRFNSGGSFTYSRGSVTVSPEVAKEIQSGESLVVVHGVDYNKDGKYDGDVKSDLDPSLPTEATDPALCGLMSAAPAGGMATGEGGAAGGMNASLVGAGAIALLAAGGAGVVATRRRRSVEG